MAKKKTTPKKTKKTETPEAPAIIAPGKDGYIHRMWAEHGVIKTQRADGTIVTMTWKSAAYRAAQLNAAVPLLPDTDVKKQYLELVERILAVVREARVQQASGNKKTQGLHNLLDGKNEDGSTVKIGNFEDYLIADYRRQFPSLSEDELAVIMRDAEHWPTVKQKEAVMRTLAARRTPAVITSP